MTSLRLSAARIRTALFAVALGAVPALAVAQSSAEIDTQVWQAVAASVTGDDIDAMARTYHPIAVLVNKDGTQPITAALKRWGSDMATQKAKGVRASVAFRFATRQDGATTAFESGAFRYATTDPAGKETVGYVRFETLLVKVGGSWRIVMEHQLDPITEAAWNALPR